MESAESLFMESAGCFLTAGPQGAKGGGRQLAQATLPLLRALRRSLEATRAEAAGTLSVPRQTKDYTKPQGVIVLREPQDFGPCSVPKACLWLQWGGSKYPASEVCGPKVRLGYVCWGKKPQTWSTWAREILPGFSAGCW